MKLFSTPRPEMKDSGISQEDRTNRTQPKNTPEPDIDIPEIPSIKSIKLESCGCQGFKCINIPTSVTSSLQPKTSRDTIISLNSDDWLFTQATSLASVNLEKDSFLITEDSGKYVNLNGNGWETKLLGKYYKTFIGAHNYIDHIQELEESHGLILDAVLRKIKTNDGLGYIYYLDILIATNKKKNPEWTSNIERERVKYLSLGCISSALQCTKCGNISFSEEDDCDCMKYEVGMNFIDDKGIKRRIAALVTDDAPEGQRGYLVFQEQSFLSVDPAFEGSITGHIIKVEPNTEVKFNIKRAALAREAFQHWRGSIKGVPQMTVIEDEDVTPDLYK